MSRTFKRQSMLGLGWNSITQFTVGLNLHRLVYQHPHKFFGDNGQGLFNCPRWYLKKCKAQHKMKNKTDFIRCMKSEMEFDQIPWKRNANHPWF